MADFNQPSFTRSEALLVWTNYALGHVGASITSNSNADGGKLSASNLEHEALDLPWQSASIATHQSAGSTILRLAVDFGRHRHVNWASIHGHNCRVPWRVRVFRNVFDGLEHETDWTDPIIRAEVGDFGYYEFQHTLGPDPYTLEALTDEENLDSPLPFTDVYNARSVHVEFDVSAASALYQTTDSITIGSLILGTSFQSGRNVLLGWEISAEDLSIRLQSRQGAVLGQPLRRLRRLSIVHGYLTLPEAFRDIHGGMVMTAGTLKRVFVWVEPQKPRYFYELAMVATVRDLPRVAMANLNLPNATGWLLQQSR